MRNVFQRFFDRISNELSISFLALEISLTYKDCFS